ncbi:MerR family transcriptional regulator [Streptomonospora nanhaiensis]|uniref:DNA-binding transcriptional MerR regulator n=1 Tax=Streptomonospora nanhaiensis TaxID=1323731 RepID=A0A853BH29_9ACTN|nr:MerR family transcriptional regulator [Streptomonospora nanhaiensis]MBV2363166.1 MerR family transcriptional regulator [Streptomonospora nanhaiensis]MBX9387440.1 MerR family transcriptional regulator [Streptomonospora nanhaiensis]NYI94340.1 DNA-binding transcriptional MerR regulator [Streptomonospora nanhaiensis]
MRIGELAARTGASVRSLRYYEEQGLLSSGRSPSGQRLYTASDVDRVLLVRRLFAAGLSSRSIVRLLPCVDSPSAETSEETWHLLLRERDRLNDHIAALTRTRESLDEVIAAHERYRHATAASAG